MSLDIGSTIQGKYRITRLIGRGGMGAVYEGENTLIARRVAIKVLHGELRSQTDALERFEREAQAAGRIGNDHILEVLDLGELANGDRFMVMEFLDGESLEDRLDRLGTLTGQELYPLTRQLLLGLDAVHSKGIIHRDLKPDNIFILNQKAGQANFVKIIDFGISKFTSNSDMRMTATGAVMGTPYYMSPEQAKGSREVDNRSDLYAVGVIMYRAVTGTVPFPGDNFNEVLFKVVLSQAVNPRDLAPGLEPGFETIIARAMARDPQYRFANASEFIAALDAWARDGSTVSVPPPSEQAPGSLTDLPTSSTVRVGSDGGTDAPWTQSSVTLTKPRSNTPWLVAGLVLFAGVAGAVALLFTDSDAGPVSSTAPSATLEPAGFQPEPEVAEEEGSAAPPVETAEPDNGPDLDPESDPKLDAEQDADSALKAEEAEEAEREPPASKKKRPWTRPVRPPPPVELPSAPPARPPVKRPSNDGHSSSGSGDVDFGY